ncbi:hypothetical protein [Bacillus paramycoides]|uniref:helix-turn-helix domain-containing protein n=1 Tax=Bacillus paramycoides TaxID=2026194 RepID=UPI003D1F3A91
MKRNLGEVFREIRESKNLKLLDVCGVDLSLSQLSRFERGECEISAYKLFSALEKINVSVEEYILAINNYQKNYIDELFSKLNEYHLQNNVKMMKSLLEQEQDKIKNSEKSIYAEINCLLISVRIQQIDPAFIIYNNDKEKLVDYLLSVNDWGYYELQVFSNVLIYMEVQTLMVLSKEIIGKYGFYKGIPKCKSIVIEVLIKIIFICTDKNYFKNATYLIKKVENLLDSEMDLYEKNLFNYVKGYYYLKNTEREKGKQLMDTTINIFEKLGCYNLSSYYKKKLDSVFSKS